MQTQITHVYTGMHTQTYTIKHACTHKHTHIPVRAHTRKKCINMSTHVCAHTHFDICLWVFPVINNFDVVNFLQKHVICIDLIFSSVTHQSVKSKAGTCCGWQRSRTQTGWTLAWPLTCSTVLEEQWHKHDLSRSFVWADLTAALERKAVGSEICPP